MEFINTLKGSLGLQLILLYLILYFVFSVIEINIESLVAKYENGDKGLENKIISRLKFINVFYKFIIYILPIILIIIFLILFITGRENIINSILLCLIAILEAYIYKISYLKKSKEHIDEYSKRFFNLEK